MIPAKPFSVCQCCRSRPAKWRVKVSDGRLQNRCDTCAAKKAKSWINPTKGGQQ